MAFLSSDAARFELERFFSVILGGVFVLAGLGLVASLLDVPFLAEPFVVWGALGGVATQATLPIVAWSEGRAYRSSTTGQVGIMLLAVAGLAAGLASVPGLNGAIGHLGRMGWLSFLVAGCLLLLHLSRAGGREGMPVPTERFAPAYGSRHNRLWDQLARYEVVAGNAYVLLAALYGLHGGWDGSAADGTGLILWYGWLGTLAAAGSLYYLPRLFGARGGDDGLLVAARALWHGGLLAALLFDRRVLLVATVLGGVILFAAVMRMLQSAGRRVFRVVGSRRIGLAPLYRQLLLVAVVFGLFTAMTVPWWNGLHSGASHILWTWLLFLFMPIVMHVFHAGGPAPGRAVLLGLSAGILGNLLGIWPGVAAEAGALLLGLSLLTLGLLLLLQPKLAARLPLGRADSTGDRRAGKR